MKQTIELTCAICGEKFTAETDYIIPGIHGSLNRRNGERVTIIDPTGEHHCESCIIAAWEKAKITKEAAFELVKGDERNGKCQEM